MRVLQCARLGASSPFGAYLRQEADRMLVVVDTARATLRDLRNVVNGAAVMSEATALLVDALAASKTPPAWERVSWTAASMSAWVAVSCSCCLFMCFMLPLYVYHIYAYIHTYKCLYAVLHMSACLCINVLRKWWMHVQELRARTGASAYVQMFAYT
jgi:hypothetical protein